MDGLCIYCGGVDWGGGGGGGVVGGGWLPKIASPNEPLKGKIISFVSVS